MKAGFKNFLDVIRKKYLLIIIFIIVLELRLFFAFQTSEFSDDNAYLVLRNVENIKQTGLPIFNDDLSYHSDNVVASPVFYYLIAFFNTFIPLTWVAKILPNLLASTIVFVVYLLGMKLTRDRNASLFAAFLSGFVPIFFIETINSVSVFSLVIPLVLYGFYSFIMIGSDDSYIYHFIVTIAILSFTHPSVFIVLFGLFVYMIMMKSESIDTKHVELEVIIVSAFFVLWSQFLIYKEAFLELGLNVIWQNLPQELLAKYFTQIDILSGIFLIGTIPVYFGVHTLYQYILEKKSRYMFFFVSYVLPIFFLLWFKLITPTIGLIFIGAILVVIASVYFHEYMIFWSKSKLAKFKGLIVTGIIIAFAITTFVPTISQSWEKINEVPSDALIESLETLKQVSKTDGIVLAPLERSHLVQFYSDRRTYLDEDFLLIPEVNQKFADYSKIYTSIYETDALRLLTKYNIKYILFTPELKREFQIEKIAYVNDENCFDLFFSKDDVELYEVLCTLVDNTEFVGDNN
jgi:hypothetical protein